jgi:inhibitor of cysteine peptidase
MKTLLSLLTLLFSLTVCAETDDALTFNVDSNQSSFVINLPANPTTGFQWTVIDFDKNLLSLSSSVYERSTSQLVGAGGIMQFTFALNKSKTPPESTSLVFKYARPWEQDAPGKLQKVVVNFK